MKVSTEELYATHDEVDRAVALSVLGARVGEPAARFYEGSRGVLAMGKVLVKQQRD